MTYRWTSSSTHPEASSSRRCRSPARSVVEFKRTLVLVTERTESVVQVRAVILIALLAIVRKLIILDIAPGDAPQLLALAVATLSLGGVYWLVQDQNIRERE